MITLTDYEITVLILSSKVAIISSLIISIPAFFLGLALATKQFYGKSIIDSVIHLPLVLPPDRSLISLLIIFSNSKSSIISSISF